MPSNYDAIDMRFTWNGDFAVGHDGDLADTSEDALLSLRQDLHTVSASALKDWELYPNIGAGLDDFIGEPNTRTRAEFIHDRIKMALVNAGVVKESDLKVRVTPVHRHKVLIVLTVSVAPTAFNKLNTSSETIRTALVFDFVEQGVYFWDKIPDIFVR